MSADAQKLAILAKSEGFAQVEDFLNRWEMLDSLVPAICMNENCNLYEEYEPDQTQGFCHDCGTKSMESALVLAGII